MKLSARSFKQAALHFIDTAKWPFVITLALGIAAALFGGMPAKVFVSALSGQLAITLFKLAFYVSLFILSIAFLFRRWPALSRPLYATGDVVAGIGFMVAATAAGVAMGLFGGLAFELPVWKALAMSLYLGFLFLAVTAVLWVAATARAVLITEVWKGAALSVAAFILAAISLSSLYCETWPEVEGLHLKRDDLACKALKKLGGRQ